MKLLRIWLLVLLAVLLPVRGGLAATMECVAGNAGTQHLVHEHLHAAAGHHHVEAAEEPAQHGHGSLAVHDHEAGTQDQCNLCSASCSATPLVRGISGVPLPGDLASAWFPNIQAPAPDFLSGGQERPPRSI